MKRKQAISVLKKLFNEKTEEENKEIPEADRRLYMDNHNVAGVIPKTEAAKLLLTENFEVTETKIPDLTYVIDKERNNKELSSKYSVEYISIFLEMLKIFGSEDIAIKIKMKDDYPLWIETGYFDFILAPRVDPEAM